MGKNPIAKMKSTVRPRENLFFVLCSLFFVVYWLFLIRPAILGQLTGTFKPKEIPQEYGELKDFIHSQPEFFRTLWIPKRQRFGFFSNNHPAIDAMEILKVSSPSTVVDWLKGERARKQLARWSVKYVIVPYDSEKELFLKDRKYDESERRRLEESLKTVQWLKRLNSWGKISVFETPEYKDHFWIENKKQITDNERQRADSKLKWQMIDPTRYVVEVENVKEPFTLVFSESFDKKWLVKTDGQKIYSKKTYDGLNSFAIKRGGDYNIEVEYELQRYVNYGLVISGVTFLVAVGSLIWLRQKS